jgi:RNA polymerase sigma-70 factor (ECF subfamily)
VNPTLTEPDNSSPILQASPLAKSRQNIFVFADEPAFRRLLLAADASSLYLLGWADPFPLGVHAVGDFEHSTTLHRLLLSLEAGDPEARTGLIGHALERLRLLARHQFRRSPRLRELDETDDVLQKALMRLHRALVEIHPGSVSEFFGLAARQIRYVILDLVRELKARKVDCFPEVCPPSTQQAVPEPAAPDEEPSSLEEWADFHDAVERLPEEQRDVFMQIFYNGLSQQEVARVFSMSLRTVQRRWVAAQLEIVRMLHGQMPPL